MSSSLINCKRFLDGFLLEALLASWQIFQMVLDWVLEFSGEEESQAYATQRLLAVWWRVFHRLMRNTLRLLSQDLLLRFPGRLGLLPFHKQSLP
mmetsp:Transcript_10024/g.24998  ORF Transcript_10024/g.24998 Transcript_10024/m.24998 type:complete len:94 (-) Transcript_10024:44-325(-)